MADETAPSVRRRLRLRKPSTPPPSGGGGLSGGDWLKAGIAVLAAGGGIVALLSFVIPLFDPGFGKDDTCSIAGRVFDSRNVPLPNTGVGFRVQEDDFNFIGASIADGSYNGDCDSAGDTVRLLVTRQEWGNGCIVEPSEPKAFRRGSFTNRNIQVPSNAPCALRVPQAQLAEIMNLAAATPTPRPPANATATPRPPPNSTPTRTPTPVLRTPVSVKPIIVPNAPRIELDRVR